MSEQTIADPVSGTLNLVVGQRIDFAIQGLCGATWHDIEVRADSAWYRAQLPKRLHDFAHDYDTCNRFSELRLVHRVSTDTLFEMPNLTNGLQPTKEKSNA